MPHTGCIYSPHKGIPNTRLLDTHILNHHGPHMPCFWSGPHTEPSTLSTATLTSQVKGQVTDSLQKMLPMASLPSAKSKSCCDGVISLSVLEILHCSVLEVSFSTHQGTGKLKTHPGSDTPTLTIFCCTTSVQSHTHTLRDHLHLGHFFKTHARPHILCYRTPETPHLIA